jgi:hypothetical protein
MHIGLVRFLAVVAGLFVGSAQAAVISVNLQGNDPSGLAATSTVGVVAAKNWNNVLGASGGPVTLKNSSGTNSGIVLSSYSVTGLGGSIGLTATNSTPQRTLFESGISANFGSVKFTLTGLAAFSSYDIIAYYDAGTSFPTDRTARVTNSATLTKTYYVRGSNTARTAYTLSNSTVSTTYASGNYVQFAGLTDSTQTITYTFVSNPTTLVGFQVIGTAVPEPASLGLVATGALVLMSRRFRLA